jgi:hypothetical protein
MVLEAVSPNMSLGSEFKDFGDSNLFRQAIFGFRISILRSVTNYYFLNKNIYNSV